MNNGTREPIMNAAPVSVIAEFAVCIDCMQWVAGITDDERGEEYPNAVADAMTAPEAAQWHLVNACTDDCGTCSTFTYHACDTCASWLAGERHAVVALSR